MIRTQSNSPVHRCYIDVGRRCVLLVMLMSIAAGMAVIGTNSSGIAGGGRYEIILERLARITVHVINSHVLLDIISGRIKIGQKGRLEWVTLMG